MTSDKHSIHYATMDLFNENWIAATIENFQMEIEENEGKLVYKNFSQRKLIFLLSTLAEFFIEMQELEEKEHQYLLWLQATVNEYQQPGTIFV
jgi:hypothetical protein